MNDFLSDYPKQMNLLIMLYQMDILKEITPKSVINEGFKNRYIQRMEGEMGITTENAVWAVDMWCTTYMRLINQ